MGPYIVLIWLALIVASIVLIQLDARQRIRGADLIFVGIVLLIFWFMAWTGFMENWANLNRPSFYTFLFLGAAGIVLIILGIRRRAITRPKPPGCCPHCGYDLTGNTSGACPECGQSK